MIGGGPTSRGYAALGLVPPMRAVLSRGEGVWIHFSRPARVDRKRMRPSVPQSPSPRQGALGSGRPVDRSGGSGESCGGRVDPGRQAACLSDLLSGRLERGAPARFPKCCMRAGQDPEGGVSIYSDGTCCRD